MKYSVLAPLALTMLLAATAAQAQLYKWVAPDGTVSYSDKPPPSNASKVERKTYAGGGSSLDELPYELATPAKSSPVTIYTYSACNTLCDSGRSMLKTRGIPYTEKTVDNNEGLAQLKKLAGDVGMPILFVGSNKQIGYNTPGWDAALTAAGYPTKNMMPKTYKNPAPSALVSPAPAVDPAKPASAPQPAAPAPASDKPAFHF